MDAVLFRLFDIFRDVPMVTSQKQSPPGDGPQFGVGATQRFLHPVPGNLAEIVNLRNAG
jgi:hypothetical protein